MLAFLGQKNRGLGYDLKKIFLKKLRNTEPKPQKYVSYKKEEYSFRRCTIPDFGNMRERFT